jgi:UPF0042 nucleotide-binding protein
MTKKEKDEKTQRPNLIVTGLSGAGMSTALKDLEDFGYEVFDNFPLTLVEALIRDKQHHNAPIAIGIDSRTRGFTEAQMLETVRAVGAKLVFLTCDEAALQQRFTETRRRHPLAKDRPPSAGIKAEQDLLFGLRAQADLVIDTTPLSARDLRRVIEGHFGPGTEERLTVTLLSFGFKYGLPREADIVMDARFLKNPHWDDRLRPLTGLDKDVCAFIENDPDLTGFLQRFETLLLPLLPRYAAEGKTYLTVAVGCTGGRHRSVYCVEKLKLWLEAQGHAPSVQHRDIGR